MCAGTVLTLRICCSFKMNFGSKRFHTKLICILSIILTYTCSDNKIVFDLRSCGKNDAVANRNAQKKKRMLIPQRNSNSCLVINIGSNAPPASYEVIQYSASGGGSFVSTVTYTSWITWSCTFSVPFTMYTQICSLAHESPFLFNNNLSSNFASPPKHWSPFFSFPEHYYLAGRRSFFLSLTWARISSFRCDSLLLHREKTKISDLIISISVPSGFTANRAKLWISSIQVFFPMLEPSSLEWRK